MLGCDVLPWAAWTGSLPDVETVRGMESASDRTLMEQVVGGDKEAFAALYRRYQRPLFGFLYRMAGARPLAEDLLQETFTRVWMAARTYDPRRGHVRPWLYTVALNVARSELGKKRHRVAHVSLEEGVEPRAEGERPLAERIDAIDRADAVARAVAGLPDFMREVIVLRCYQQLSFEEMGQVTGAPLGTLKSRFHRAVAALRAELREAEESADA